MMSAAPLAGDSWQRRIQRAAQLAEQDEAARALLTFYGRLLAVQRDAYDAIGRHDDRLSGSLERDLPMLRRPASAIVTAVAAIAPASLADEASQIAQLSESDIDQILLGWWRARSDRQFFPKVILQPYAQRLAQGAIRPVHRHPPAGDHHAPAGDRGCPFCGGAPQVSILQGGGELEGGSRLLQCATCLMTWPFRRVRCASCGEEAEHRLAYFHAPAFDHLRVDACDACKRYIKSVDLTRLGVAVPLVDEIAGAMLDLWARERGYEKIELNLVGL